MKLSPPSLVCAAFVSACSAYYPVGEAPQSELPVGDDAGSTAVRAIPPLNSPLVGAPSVTVDNFGEKLVAVGDLDGDGHDDLVSVSFDSVTEHYGVRVRYSGKRWSTDAEASRALMTGDAFLFGLDELSFEVFPAGDVDGDGYADFLLSTAACSEPEPGAGTYLVYGGPERLSGTLPLDRYASHFVPPEGPAAASDLPTCFGTQITRGVGDLDGDGVGDFLIAHEPDALVPDSTGTGGLYLFYGRRERFSAQVPYEAADAWLHTGNLIDPLPLGDVNGDGLADVLIDQHGQGLGDVLIDDHGIARQAGAYFLAGSGDRWSGPGELGDQLPLLVGAHHPSFNWASDEGFGADFDGDGISDVILQDDGYRVHLFYGGPGLFETGIDYSSATNLIADRPADIHFIPDRDGDGRAELVEQFAPSDGPLEDNAYSLDAAVLNGRAERLGLTATFPEDAVHGQHPDGLYGNPLQALDSVVGAGDLDGDGLQDLITTSEIVLVSGFETRPQSMQLHIHYGVPSGGDWTQIVR